MDALKRRQPWQSAAGQLSERERALLRRTARKTWRYFETFVTEADGWLVPDNYQEAGDAPRLARRTSPTNIGMGLLSTLAAHDLCSKLKPYRKKRHLQPGVGHYGVFSGRKWEGQIYPIVKNVILASD